MITLQEMDTYPTWKKSSENHRLKMDFSRGYVSSQEGNQPRPSWKRILGQLKKKTAKLSFVLKWAVLSRGKLLSFGVDLRVTL